MSFTDLDSCLTQFIYSKTELLVSDEFKHFSTSLHNFSDQFQNALQIGSLALADPKKVNLVVELDNALEEMSVLKRIEFIEHIVAEPYLLLKENNVDTGDFTVQSFKTYWESELFLMRASVKP